VASFGWQASFRSGMQAKAVRYSPKGEGGDDTLADVAQLAERVLGKDEVTSSILVIGSRFANAARSEC
jgi:hypothetical protein